MVLATLLSVPVWVGAAVGESHPHFHGSLVPGHPALQAGGSRVGPHAHVPLRFSDPASVPAAAFATTSRDFYPVMFESDGKDVINKT